METKMNKMEDLDYLDFIHKLKLNKRFKMKILSYVVKGKEDNSEKEDIYPPNDFLYNSYYSDEEDSSDFNNNISYLNFFCHYFSLIIKV